MNVLGTEPRGINMLTDWLSFAFSLGLRWLFHDFASFIAILLGMHGLESVQGQLSLYFRI